MMRNLLNVCAAYLIWVVTPPSVFIVDAHSWVEKVESTFGTGMSRFGLDTKSDSKLLRYFCPLPTLDQCQPDPKHNIVYEPSAMRPCRADHVSDPKATVAPGTDLTIHWAGNGHVGNGQSDGTCVKVMIAPFEADPAFEDFSNIAGAECLEFSITDVDGNQEPEGVITIPDSLSPGEYTLLWYWKFTEFVYSSCIDISVSGSSPVVPTASPTAEELGEAVIQNYLAYGCSDLPDPTDFCTKYTTESDSYCLDNDKDECGRSVCSDIGNFLLPCGSFCPPGCPKPKPFFDDFSNGLDSAKWLVAHKSWGSVDGGFLNGGVVEENVEADTAAGTVIFHAHGSQYAGPIQGINKDLTRQSTGVRTGGAIATRDYLGAGSYEIRMKAAEELGVCSAIWTFYYNNDDHCSEGSTPIVNHEIDIELPGRPGAAHVNMDFDQALLNTWVGEIGSLYEAGYTQLPSRQDDGQFHTWRFDWHTDEADRRVDFYLDGMFLRTMRNHIPFYASRLWLGAWFPASWAGEPNFDTSQMEIDWVRFTPFDEAYECPDESYPDLGWAPNTSFAEPTAEKCGAVPSYLVPSSAPLHAPVVAPVVPAPVPTPDGGDDFILEYYDYGCQDLPSTFCSDQTSGSYCKDWQSDECGRSICHYDSHSMLSECSGDVQDDANDDSLYLATGCADLMDPDMFCSGYNGGYCKDWQSDSCGRSICQGDSFLTLDDC